MSGWQVLDCGNYATTFYVGSITNANSLDSVRATIHPPKDSGQHVVDLKAVQSAASEWEYELSYGNCINPGTYTIVFYAVDANDHESEGIKTTVIQKCGINDKTGDLYLDYKTNLADAIVALNILTGMSDADLLRPDYIESRADVNDFFNPAVEPAELIYILQYVSGLRE